MKYVVDTSVIAKVFLDETGRDEALAVVSAAMDRRVELIAPSLLLCEMNNVLIRNGLSRDLHEAALREIHDWIGEGIIAIIEPDLGLLQRAASIARTDTKELGHISSFDATFHALAALNGGLFITADDAYVQKTQTLIGNITRLAEFRVP